MLEEILKRNGEREEFVPYKIEDAIKKAFKSENVIYDNSLFFRVIERLKPKRTAAVEDIQDLIEKELYKARYFDVMKSFMLYRLMHKMKREHTHGFSEDTTYINAVQTIEEYINGTD